MEFAYKMTPAFRHGVMTPWGGSKLKTLYGKEIPDGMTGESLEASTLPGLESRLPDGRTLTFAAARCRCCSSSSTRRSAFPFRCIRTTRSPPSMKTASWARKRRG